MFPGRLITVIHFCIIKFTRLAARTRAWGNSESAGGAARRGLRVPGNDPAHSEWAQPDAVRVETMGAWGKSSGPSGARARRRRTRGLCAFWAGREGTAWYLLRGGGCAFRRSGVQAVLAKGRPGRGLGEACDSGLPPLTNGWSRVSNRYILPPRYRALLKGET